MGRIRRQHELRGRVDFRNDGAGRGQWQLEVGGSPPGVWIPSATRSGCCKRSTFASLTAKVALNHFGCPSFVSLLRYIKGFFISLSLFWFIGFYFWNYDFSHFNSNNSNFSVPVKWIEHEQNLMSTSIFVYDERGFGVRGLWFSGG